MYGMRTDEKSVSTSVTVVRREPRWALLGDSRHVVILGSFVGARAHQSRREGASTTTTPSPRPPQTDILVRLSAATGRSPGHPGSPPLHSFSRGKIADPSTHGIGICTSSALVVWLLSIKFYGYICGAREGEGNTRGKKTKTPRSEAHPIGLERRVKSLLYQKLCAKLLGRSPATTNRAWVYGTCKSRLVRRTVARCGGEPRSKVNEYMLWRVVHGEVSKSCR